MGSKVVNKVINIWENFIATTKTQFIMFCWKDNSMLITFLIKMMVWKWRESVYGNNYCTKTLKCLRLLKGKENAHVYKNEELMTCVLICHIGWQIFNVLVMSLILLSRILSLLLKSQRQISNFLVFSVSLWKKQLCNISDCFSL